MSLTKELTGEICQYCKRSTNRVPGKFGEMMKCEPCNAWVTVDRSTGLGLGTVANEALREARKVLQAAIKKCIDNNYFTQDGIERLIYNRGGVHSRNLYRLSLNAVKSISGSLSALLDEKANKPYRKLANIKEDLKLHYYK